MMRQEPALRALLRQRMNIPVPQSIGFSLEHEQIDQDYLLIERLPGTPLSDHSDHTWHDSTATGDAAIVAVRSARPRSLRQAKFSIN